MLSSVRLSYRLVDQSEAAMLCAHWNRPEVRRYLWDNVELSVDAVSATIARSIKAHGDFGGGLWWLLADDGFVGVCGLLPVFSELDSLLTEKLDASVVALVGDAPMVEVLYSLEPSNWGNGFAIEATRSLLTHGLGALGLGVVFGGVDLDNDRSAKVLRSVGMKEIARFDGDVGQLVYFAAFGPSVLCRRKYS